MKRMVRVTVSVFALLSALVPTSLYAQSQSVSFTVSVTIPEQIQLTSPALMEEVGTASLTLPAPKFWVGDDTNMKRHIDASFCMREIDGKSAKVFTLTAL